MNLTLTAKDDALLQALKKLKSRQDIARLLEVPDKVLRYILYVDRDKYFDFTIRKRSGGLRVISAPTDSLKILQQKLSYILALHYVPRPSVHGFTKNRSIVSNARVHVGSKIVFNLDLTDFFPTINFGRVRGLFLSKPFNLPAEVATVLAQICCYNHSLPQGAPTSPIISNYICFMMDGEIQRLAKNHKCLYTRYADDITISTYRKFIPTTIAKTEYVGDNLLVEVGEPLRELIERNGFNINDAKVRISHKHKRQQVTGININQGPNVRRKYVKQIQAMLNAWEVHGLDAASKEHYEKYRHRNVGYERKEDFTSVVEGKINFLRMVKGDKDNIFRKLANKFIDLSKKPKAKYPLTAYQNIINSIWRVDSGGKTGTAFMLEGVGIITNFHVIDSGSPINVYKHNDWVVAHHAEILEYSKEMDLAILRLISKQSFPELKLGRASTVDRGDNLTIVGYPAYRLSDQPFMYDCKVSGFRSEGGIQRIIVDLVMIGGQSGSPAIDKNDHVVGVVVSGVKHAVQGQITQDYGIIPIDVIKDMLIKTAIRTISAVKGK